MKRRRDQRLWWKIVVRPLHDETRSKDFLRRANDLAKGLPVDALAILGQNQLLPQPIPDYPSHDPGVMLRVAWLT